MYDAGQLIIACATYKLQLLQGNTHETNDTGPTCVCILFIQSVVFLVSIAINIFVLGETLEKKSLR